MNNIMYIPQTISIAQRVNNPVRLTACIQAHNESEFIGLNLRHHYDMFDRIIVVEGAVKNRANSTPDGHSTDNTIEIIEDFKKNHDPLNKIVFIKINKHWAHLEEMKQVFLDMSMDGDWLVINDCLSGYRCVPVKIDGKICVYSLEELFEHYLSLGYKIINRGNKERIEVNNLETLSVVDVLSPEHSLYRSERDLELSSFFRDYCTELQLKKVNAFENGELIFPGHGSGTGTVTALRKKFSYLKNVVSEWKKVSVISRCKTDKDIIRISQKYGETECTVDHGIASLDCQNNVLDYSSVEAFENKMVQISTIVDHSSTLSSINLSDWLDMTSFYIEGGNLHYKSPHPKRRWPYIKNNLRDTELLNFCEFLGFYVAEGSVVKDDLRQARICGTEKKYVDLYHRYLLDISDHKFDENAGELRSKTIYNKNITSGVIIRLLAQLCGIGSNNKKIPDFIFNLENKFKLAFLSGYQKGDGHITDYGMISSTTVSMKLHAGVCLLNKQLGIRYTVSHREPEEFYDKLNHKRSYTIDQNKQRDQITRSLIRKTNLGKTQDYVYDLTVPDTHNFCDADGMIVVHNCDEFYRAEDICRLRRAIDLNPHACEFVPNFLHFYGDFWHVAKPGPEWQPQHQRVFKYMRGMKYNSHPVVTDPAGHCTYFPPHYQSRRVMLNDFWIYHYGYARRNMDIIMRDKQVYYEKELASHSGANKKFDKKVKDWFDDTEPLLYYDGEHPEIIKTCPRFLEGPRIGWRTYPAAIESGLIKYWRDDPFYSKVLKNEPWGNIWLCMTKQSQPYMSFYHNSMEIQK